MRPGDRPNRFHKPEKNEKHAVNDAILAPEVRVIGDNGEQLGVLKTRDAIRMAEEAGMDLVEVAATATPPVCRILDYGKLRYREQKKAAESRRRSAVHTTKEIRLRYSTDKHDVETKVRHARRFLMEGDRVRFEMRFRGREVMYEELGRSILNGIVQMLEDIAVVDERTNLIGQRMHLAFAPKGGVK